MTSHSPDLTARERPIVFGAPMVRAILDGRKTQTRRIVKPQPPQPFPGGVGPTWEYWPDREVFVPMGTLVDFTAEMRGGIRCPYGQPGDRLIVRERWATDPCYDHFKPSALKTSWPILYESGDGRCFTRGFHRVRSPIHMPRWASRLTLEVTGVLVERVQEISEADAVAEGTAPINIRVDAIDFPYRAGYAALWDSINGKGSWASNPWVWALEFRRITRLEAGA